MANEKNIIPHQFTSEQSREEAAKNGRKGGVASGAARRAKREARETAKRILSYKPEVPPELLNTLHRMGMSKKRISPDMREIITLAIAQKGMKGDVKSYQFLVELAGETAEAAMLEAKAEEVERRSGMEEEDNEEALRLMDADGIRQRMSEMTDEELEQYERLCAKFGGDGE